MKFLLLLVSIFFTTISTSLCQKNNELYNFEKWQEESFENIRLLPRYGYAYKAPGQLAADAEFIKSIKSLEDFTDMRSASNHQVELGFNYLQRGDLRTAMYRFNQAYLLDSTNTDDYWGYGAVYMQLGRPDLAEHQYKTGLSKDSFNHHLWTDLATVYSTRAQENKDTVALKTAIQYLQKSYAIEPGDVNTVYKLSVTHYLMGNCKEAKRYFEECVKMGGQRITPAFRVALEDDCR